MITHELDTLTTTDMDAGTLFSGKASGRMIRGYSAPCSFTPRIDPDYLFHDSMRDIVVWLLSGTEEKADPLYIFGPTGSGKTSLVRQLAARLNYPVFDVTGHGRLEFPDLAGHLSVQSGNMVYQYGPLALAMRYGGLFLLNEADLLDPATATGLNGVLDGGPLCIPENGGEIIQPHPMFRFVATANTNGASDESGLYQGTLRQNIALMDRFYLCEVGYPAQETEVMLLERIAPDIPQDIRETMVSFAGEVRRLFMGESEKQKYGETIDITFSTRTLIRWATLARRFQPLARQGIQPIGYALDRALGFRASRETRAMLHELAQRMFPTAESQQTTDIENT
ncbi:ATPase associated with various cellular activities AAA_5 [Oleidesulfovibrio alaskensis G20]|jgi:cobaltochelatase CobS|uniref:ATPase associated with various cellular activities AAA_5 n=1 Tax=Oleidesulfovibrio alaskensis (strain ATCC BAA-1058 / DSM 17464 / G20) TaxID=207559 RepID=Q30X80_OLEA2|nr:AAA family ATPase [Oleidesulfovibrio alaskensis]ABB39716.1 ATPase associated with various cellular activities AAA_5 [Oleidesulfovibrio alaskensis G20]